MDNESASQMGQLLLMDYKIGVLQRMNPKAMRCTNSISS